MSVHFVFRVREMWMNNEWSYSLIFLKFQYLRAESTRTAREKKRKDYRGHSFTRILRSVKEESRRLYKMALPAVSLVLLLSLASFVVAQETPKENMNRYFF